MTPYNLNLTADFINSICAKIGKAVSIQSIGPSGLADGSIGTKYVVRVGEAVFEQTFGGTWKCRHCTFQSNFEDWVNWHVSNGAL